MRPIFLQDIPTKIFAESLWDKIFDTEIVSALGHALGDKNMNIRASTINFFTAALAQGAHAVLFLWAIHIEIFADGVRAKIFETETVAALGRAIVGIRDSAIGTSIVKFFTAAIAQGVLCCLHRIFILKYLQRAFRTKYLIPGSLPHLNVH